MQFTTNAYFGSHFATMRITIGCKRDSIDVNGSNKYIRSPALLGWKQRIVDWATDTRRFNIHKHSHAYIIIFIPSLDLRSTIVDKYNPLQTNELTYNDTQREQEN